MDDKKHVTIIKGGVVEIDQAKPILSEDLMHTGFRALAQRLDKIIILLEGVADELAKRAEG